MRMKMTTMKIMTTKLNIMGDSYEDGMFHFILENKCEIPLTIEYSRHFDRHFIFYNCKVVEILERNYLDSFLKKQKDYKYKVTYEKKFTSKFKDEVYSNFISYIREKKLNILL